MPCSLFYLGFVTWIGFCHIWAGYLGLVTGVGVCQILVGLVTGFFSPGLSNMGGRICQLWGARKVGNIHALFYMGFVTWIGFVTYGLVLWDFSVGLGFVKYGWVLSQFLSVGVCQIWAAGFVNYGGHHHDDKPGDKPTHIWHTPTPVRNPKEPTHIRQTPIQMKNPKYKKVLMKLVMMMVMQVVIEVIIHHLHHPLHHHHHDHLDQHIHNLVWDWLKCVA